MTKNVAQSVMDRLLKHAKARGEDFNFVLVQYGIERLVARLSASPHGASFVLKGATLFSVWSAAPHRATKDLDLLGVGEPDLERLAAIFREVVAANADDDGLVFDPSTIEARRIKEDAECEGVRVTGLARLGAARLSIQVDIGFGDAVTPEPTEVAFPTLLNAPRPRVRIYPRETVVAEKTQAIVHLGLLNSRMKDYFDLWFLARTFDFEKPLLARAVARTFERRGTALPRERAVGLSDAFTSHPQKRAQWKAFSARLGRSTPAGSLDDVIGLLREFLEPLFTTASNASEVGSSTWGPGGPWQ